MQEHRLYEDETSRIISSYLAFLDVLAGDGPQAYTRIGGYSLSAQVELSSHTIEGLLQNRPGSQKVVTDLRSGAQELLRLDLANLPRK